MRRIGSWLWSRRDVLVFLLVLASALPALMPLLRRAGQLAPLDVESRRAAVMGDFYRSLRDVPRDRPAAILLLGHGALDQGVFVNYYLYPAAARMHQDRVSTDAPPSILAVANTGPVRRTVVAHPPPGEAPRRFVVPFVASALGKDSYTTEALIEGNAPVTLTLMPFGVIRVIQPPFVFSDVVQEMLGRRETGWLRVEAAGPLRAAFWFVARADAVAVPLPLVTGVPASPQTVRGERLWLLNPDDQPATAHVNGRAETLAAHELRQTGGATVNTVDGDVIAFTSGTMTFDWGAR